MLFTCAFVFSYLGIELHTRTNGNPFNLARLRATRKVKFFTVRYLLFAVDAALVAHSAQNLQTLLSQFSSACLDLGLTISLRKKKQSPKSRNMYSTINQDRWQGYRKCKKKTLYLCSSIASNASLDTNINCCIGKA